VVLGDAERRAVTASTRATTCVSPRTTDRSRGGAIGAGRRRSGCRGARETGDAVLRSIAAEAATDLRAGRPARHDTRRAFARAENGASDRSGAPVQSSSDDQSEDVGAP